MQGSTAAKEKTAEAGAVKWEAMLTGVLLLALAAFGAYNYLFSIYETAVLAEPTEVPGGEASTVTITTIPLNSLGFRAPCRSSPAEFTITGGNSLLVSCSADTVRGVLTLVTSGEPGTITIRVKPKYALLATEVTIRVQANAA